MPDPGTIRCPYCHKEIPLTEAISHRIREQVEKEFEGEAQKKELEFSRKEQALLLREQEIEKSRQSLEDQLLQRMGAERERIEKEARQKAAEDAGAELQDLREQIAEQARKIGEAQRMELELRKQRRELEESRKALELEMVRRMDEERARIRETALQEIAEEHRLKDLDREKLIGDMKRQIDDLKRKAEQGSQQIQGEVLELELEEILRAGFPLDRIEPVPKGIRGADILQKVHSPAGQYCGTIIWESKRTKAWNEAWLDKLRDDQRETKAEVAILMTTALPKEVGQFAFMKGVWVTNCACALGLATALRLNLFHLAAAQSSLVGKNEKMEVLYNYLSGPQFRQKVEAIVEAFHSLKEDLDQEKRAMARIWAKREKQIERVVQNTAGMYGDMQGIIGATLPEIKSLELQALSAGDDPDGSEEDKTVLL